MDIISDIAFDILSDIISEIIAHVTAGSTYKACALVSRAWHKAAWAHSYKIEGMTNQLQTLLMHFPDEDWDWSCVSASLAITYDFVAANRYMDWD